MTADEVRKLFVEENGRFDLVVDYDGEDYSDAGANRYLDRAQGLLDRLVTPHGHKERRLFTIDSADSSVVLEGVVRIDDVFVMVDNELRALEYQPDFTTLIKNVEGIEDPGVPCYWGLNVSITDRDDLTPYDGVKGVGEDYSKKVILFYPSPEEEVTLQIIGRFRSLPLSETENGSYWTQETYLAALLGAARFYLMQSLAAGTGTREALESLLFEVRQLQFDQIEIEDQDYRDYVL